MTTRIAVARKAVTRIAVVDVGTNTTRLFVADVQREKVVAELTRVSQVTRLGEGVDATGMLAPQALEREYAALANYAQRLIPLRPDRQVAVMTSAVRDASNGEEFAATVADRFGLDVHVISGEQEAQLTYRGATDHLSANDDQRTLVFDIGGGSTELILGNGRTPDFSVSTQAGVVRQADRHIHQDPPSAAELAAVGADINEILAAAVPTELRHQTVQRAIGVAGTPTSLAAIAQALDPYDPARVDGFQLSAEERDEIAVRLGAMPLKERQQVPGLHPDRAAAILPGIVILKAIMDLFGLATVTVSEHDILRGAALSFASAAD